MLHGLHCNQALYKFTRFTSLMYGNTRPPAQNTQIHDTKNTKGEKVQYAHCEMSILTHVKEKTTTKNNNNLLIESILYIFNFLHKFGDE